MIISFSNVQKQMSQKILINIILLSAKEDNIKKSIIMTGSLQLWAEI